MPTDPSLLPVEEGRENEATRLPCVAIRDGRGWVLVVETHLLCPYFT